MMINECTFAEPFTLAIDWDQVVKMKVVCSIYNTQRLIVREEFELTKKEEVAEILSKYKRPDFYELAQKQVEVYPMYKGRHFYSTDQSFIIQFNFPRNRGIVGIATDSQVFREVRI